VRLSRLDGKKAKIGQFGIVEITKNPYPTQSDTESPRRNSSDRTILSRKFNKDMPTMKCFNSLASITVSFLIVSICFQFGCRPQQPLFLGETGRWQHHSSITRATDIEIPNVNVRSLPEVCHTRAPLTLDNPDPDAMWDLTLEEAIHITLKNSTVIRTLTGVSFTQGGVGGVPGALLGGGGQARTVFDPALMESDPRFGQEAALAAFDAQFRTGLRYERNAQARGRDAGTFHTGISKYTAPGTQFYASHNHRIDRPESRLPGGRDGTWHGSSFEVGFQHPLLRGSGIEFNRIAGPGGTPGVYGGVAVARINTDMSLTDFEIATRNLVADVERAYWNLYYAYHRLESVRSGRNAAYMTWHQTRVHYEESTRRGSAQNLAQAERNYFEFRRQVELAQNNLFRAETAMRYIMGLTASDGRLIRPIDDPITAPIALEWHNVLCEALFRSPELRRQRWAVKQRELEYRASRNFLLPQLDLDGGYRIGGHGPNMMGRDSAYSPLGGGNNYGSWIGLTLSTPLGFRREQAGVQHAQFSLARARAILREQELELTHQLGDSFREISLAYQLMQTTLSSYQAAKNEVRAVQVTYDEGMTTLDQVLNAQRWLSEAETAYYSAVIDYNLAIMTLHFRKGSLLEYNNICLAEGEWPGKAYFDARRRARERDAGRYFNYGMTLPGIVSRGVYQQHQHGYNQHGFNSTRFESLPFESVPATSVPVPALPGERSIQLAPPPPTTFNNGFRVIETDSVMVVPTPILPLPGGNTTASFTEEVPTPVLTPARGMHYVR